VAQTLIRSIGQYIEQNEIVPIPDQIVEVNLDARQWLSQVPMPLPTAL